MRAIVIGGCGFLGGDVGRELLMRGHDVIVYDKAIVNIIEGARHISDDITDLFSLRGL
jgi:nucleoside-diphosphate-sugar epimerase